MNVQEALTQVKASAYGAVNRKKLDEELSALNARLHIFKEFGWYIPPQNISFVTKRTTQDGMQTTWQIDFDNHTIFMDVCLKNGVATSISPHLGDDDEYYYEAGPEDLAELLERLA